MAAVREARARAEKASRGRVTAERRADAAEDAQRRSAAALAEAEKRASLAQAEATSAVEAAKLCEEAAALALDPRKFSRVAKAVAPAADTHQVRPASLRCRRGNRSLQERRRAGPPHGLVAVPQRSDGTETLIK